MDRDELWEEWSWFLDDRHEIEDKDVELMVLQLLENSYQKLLKEQYEKISSRKDYNLTCHATFHFIRNLQYWLKENKENILIVPGVSYKIGNTSYSLGFDAFLFYLTDQYEMDQSAYIAAKYFKGRFNAIENNYKKFEDQRLCISNITVYSPSKEKEMKHHHDLKMFMTYGWVPKENN
jgi:hypothetical protein